MKWKQTRKDGEKKSEMKSRAGSKSGKTREEIKRQKRKKIKKREEKIKRKEKREERGPKMTDHRNKNHRRQQILQAIHDYKEVQGCCPSMQDIADIVGISETTVRFHINKLVDDGRLIHPEGGRRALGLPKEFEPSGPA